MPKATLIVDEKTVYPDGTIVQMVVWVLPERDLERSHGLKYSLFYGMPGIRLVGYDNERGKGDHKHLGSLQVPYRFTSLEKLIADFRDDVQRARQKR
jgi:hypothetical protein